MAITKRPNGSWLVSIYQPDKPYIRKTFKTREEARKYEVIIKGELAKGNDDIIKTLNDVLSGKISKRDSIADHISFEEYLNDWHEERIQSEALKIGTLQRARDFIDKYIIPILGSYALSSIDSKKLYIVRDHMKDKGLSLNTIKHCLDVIKASINQATKKRLLPFYPLADFVSMKITSKDVKKVQPLSIEDQDSILKVAIDYSNKENDQRRFMLYYILVNTGMRYGELVGLKWKDINLNNKTLKIERQCIYAYGNTNPTLADPKTDKSRREIDLTDHDVAEIKRYKSWLSSMMLPVNELPFIPTLDGSHLNKDFGRSTLRTFLKLSGLPHYPIHSLRHTHATNLANTSIPIKKLSDRLGHSDIGTTMNIYSKDRLGENISYLEEANVKRANI